MTTQHEHEIAHLRAEVALLRDAVAGLTAAPAPLVFPEVPTPTSHAARHAAPPVRSASAVTGISDESSTDDTADRRAFLRGGALAASVFAAGAAASVAGAAPAAALNGDPILAGRVTGSAANTTLIFDPPQNVFQRYGFMVNDGPQSGNSIIAPAVLGYASGDHLVGGVQGITEISGGYGVYGVGRGSQSTGVRGEGPSYGVLGLADEGVSGGVGVRGAGDEAGVFGGGLRTGVIATSPDGIGLEVTGGRAALHLIPQPFSPLTNTAFHAAGEVISAVAVPGEASLWFCVKSGTPGTWRLLAAPGDVLGALILLESTFRLYDSRPGNPPTGGPKTKLTSGNSPRTIDFPFDFPPRAILVNLTVVNTSAGGGFVALHQGGTPWPGNSSINWTAANTVIANAATVVLNDQTQFSMTCASGASTDIIIDVIGVYL